MSQITIGCPECGHKFQVDLDPLKKVICPLHAAAPELLAACEQFDFAITGLGDDEPSDAVARVIWQQLRDAASAARAAITKAKGV